MFWSLENIFIFYYYIWHDLQDISIDMCHILFSTYIPWIEYAFYSQLIPFYSIHYFTWITGTENQWLTYLVMSECTHLDVKLLRRVWLFAIPYLSATQNPLQLGQPQVWCWCDPACMIPSTLVQLLLKSKKMQSQLNSAGSSWHCGIWVRKGP